MDPPKIVVIGDESAGKSTILEQLARLPVFPRKKRFCTRLAIHVRLRRSESINASLSVYNVPAEGPYVQDGQPMQVPQENGWIWVQEKMASLVEELSERPTKMGIVKDKIIVLEVRRPDVPSIDLVDLPGLTTVPKDKAEEIQEVLKRQLSEDARTGGHSMYLAVVPASGDVRPSTNMAMQFVQDNMLQNKTFGVFSKCDQVSDPDILCCLVTGKATEDGDEPEALGAVELTKGWVTTMLKPPHEKELQVHNFERLLIQHREDADFFKSKEYKQIVDYGQAGMGALVRRLELEYSNYLNTTWKDGAMKRILEKLAGLEFDLSMLGVVEGETKKLQLARKEVERRFGPDSPVKELHDRFRKDVLHDQICVPVRRILGDLRDTKWEGHDVHKNLESVRNQVKGTASSAVQQIEEFWMPKLKEILVAESKVDDADGDIVTEVACGIRMRLFGKGESQRNMRKVMKQTPLIQLNHYPDFTSAIIANCKSFVDRVAQDLGAQVQDLTDRFLDPDSPWLRLQPELALPAAQMADGKVSSKVKVKCDEQGFLDALVALFLRKAPTAQDLQGMHQNVNSVGMEEGAAKQKHEELLLQIKKVKAARDGIRKAFAITDEEFAMMELQIDAEPVVQGAAQA
eukprot:TRINITY_DN32401_c0_g1_i1.p1 TRINITY_DN32401_c0_g1~~TRINITY_DN32401_c0_g1_i1.p1  ORF type:complete len:630 (+),score=135.12 TRINITY_DN32401_c0_g1_i1:560-2449(+)